MSNRPRPAANGIDLAMFAQRAEFEQLVAKYREVAARAQAAGIATDLVLLTARFEVLIAILGNALGVDPDRLMLDVESQAVGRALDKLGPMIDEVQRFRAQAKAEGLITPDQNGS